MATIALPWAEADTTTLWRKLRAPYDPLRESDSVYLDRRRAGSPVPLEVEAYLAWLTTRDFAGDGQPVAPRVVARARGLWAALRTALPGLPAPSIAPGPDGSVVFSWDSPGDHFLAEVMSDGSLEFFHEAMATGRLWEESVDDDGDIPSDAIARLKNLA